MIMAITEDMSKLELAAQIVMAPPNQVSVQDRKDAEAFFMRLREGAISVDHCRQILDSTQNHFLMFELARALVSRMLKDWPKFSHADVQSVFLYLLNFPITHPNLPSFVSTEMFHSASKIVKRAISNKDDLFPDFLEILEKFLSNENTQLQTYGLQIIELTATEFSTAWRSSNISISWDFHLKAKKFFEDFLLKKLMQLSLRTLSRLMENSDLSSPVDQQVCDKFLKVASLIFCWNFSPKYLYLHFKILISAFRSNNFRPPESWHELFRDTSIVTFFMKLHSRVRFNEVLCQNSMVCLAQLASLMGDALSPGGQIVMIIPPQLGDLNARRQATSISFSDLEKEMATTGGNKKQLHDQYVQLFTQHLIELFSDCVLDHEMTPLSLVIYKLFTCHPIAIFERFPTDLLHKFIDFIVANILKLTQPAMSLALQKNDQTFHEPLVNLYQVWHSILRSAHMFNKETTQSIETRNPEIIGAFMKSVLSPPFGNRTKPSSNEIYDENEEEEDDRHVFMDLLSDFGFFSLYSIDFFVDYISQAMVQRLKELRGLDVASCSQELLRVWQEDFHWLLLMTGYFIRQPAYSNIGNFPEELVIRCKNGYNSGEYAKLDKDNFEQLFTSCIVDPPFDPANYPVKLDPITLLSTQVLSWFSMEHQMLLKLDANAPLLSPTLCQTSLWQFSLLMIVLTPTGTLNDTFGGGLLANDGDDEEQRGEEADEWQGGSDWQILKHLPSISPKSALSAQIIQMALQKLFTILTKMSGEKRLCADVIELLINFSEYRGEELATNEHLYSLLSELNIETLPTCRPLCKSLVMIGANIESDVFTKRILDPLMSRFLAVCDGQQATDSQLADFFECFTGVADAGQSSIAQTLFNYLQPVFARCVPLIQTRPDAQVLLVSILEFLKSCTDVLFFYVESREDTMAYHQLLICVINAYKDTQLQRFRTLAIEEEQQIHDLSTLIEILSLSISKTYLPLIEAGNNALDSANVSLHGLEILLPLMSEDLLKMPQLCTSFFRLLIFISDIAPAALAHVSPQMLNGFMGCVQMALDNIFGIERVRSALEIVANLATHCLSEMQKGQPVSQVLAENVLKLIPKVFEMAMQFSCEVEIFNEATGALYTLYNLNPDTFKAYVSQLLSLPANMEANPGAEQTFATKPHLEQAFTKLLTEREQQPDESSPAQQLHRYTASKKRLFQEKFRDFLVEVSGSLCLS